MTQECTFGNHQYYRKDATWWECRECGVLNNFEPKPGSMAKEINRLRQENADLILRCALAENLAEKPKLSFETSPFVGNKSVDEIIDTLSTYYPVPVAGQHYAAHLKYEFAQLRKQRKDAESADELEHNRANEWQAEGACDACGGMGGIIDCMCGGSGRAKDAVIYLRKEGWRLQELVIKAENDKDDLHKENVRWREVAATTNASNPATLDECIKLLKGNFDRGYAWGLNKRTDEIALLRGWVSCHYMHDEFGPCMKCGFPGWHSYPVKKEYQGYQPKYPGDCGFCGVCEACKAGRT